MARFAFEALGIELTEGQPDTSANKANEKKSRTMKKVIAAAGLGAALIAGPLLGAGTANAESTSETFERHAVALGFYNPDGRIAMVASGLRVCVNFDSGYSPAQVLYNLWTNNNMSQSDAVTFARLAVRDMCPEYTSLTN